MVRSLHHLPFQSFPSSSPSPSPPPPLLRFSSSFEAISPSCLPLLRPGRDAHGSNRTRFRKEGCGCDTWTRRLAPRYRDIASIASVTARRYVKEGYPSLSLSLSLSIADRYLGCAGAFLRSFCSTFARRSFFFRGSSWWFFELCLEVRRGYILDIIYRLRYSDNWIFGWSKI